MVGSYAGAALAIVGFSWLLLRLGLFERARLINGIVRQSAATAANQSLTDFEKEQAVRRGSVALFRHFAWLTFGFGLALGLPILLIWLLSFAQLWSFEGVLQASVSWPFLIAGLMLFVATMLLQGRRREE